MRSPVQGTVKNELTWTKESNAGLFCVGEHTETGQLQGLLLQFQNLVVIFIQIYYQ